MKPDDLGRALLLMVQDVFGTQGQFRSTPITAAEWSILDSKWVNLLARHRPRDERRGKKEERNGAESNSYIGNDITAGGA